jgi:hypothetical protein
MVKPNIKYRVTLTGEEREFLQRLVKKGNTAGYRIRHAQILLALDEIPANAHWSDARIGEAYGARQQAVGKLAGASWKKALRRRWNAKSGKRRHRL